LKISMVAFSAVFVTLSCPLHAQSVSGGTTSLPVKPVEVSLRAIDEVGITGDYRAVEGHMDNFVLRFVRLPRQYPTGLRVHFKLEDGLLKELEAPPIDPVAGADLATLSRGYVDFGPNETEKVISAYARDDGLIEGYERFRISISPSDNYKIITADQKVYHWVPDLPYAPFGTLVSGEMHLRIFDQVVLFGNEDVQGAVKNIDGIPEPLAHYNDISQGALGDCQLLTGVAIAWFMGGSDLFTRMINEIGDGGYRVELKSGAVFLPRNLLTGGTMQASLGGGDFKSRLPEVWVQVLEKALITRHQSPVCAGPVKEVVADLTGVAAERVTTNGLTLDFLKANRGRIYIGTIRNPLGGAESPTSAKLLAVPVPWSPVNGDLIYEHAMVITDVYLDPYGIVWVSLFNPHGINRSGWIRLSTLLPYIGEIYYWRVDPTP
jgi:hypothetical protein